MIRVTEVMVSPHSNRTLTKTLAQHRPQWGILSSEDAQPLAKKGKIPRSKVVVREQLSWERPGKTHWLVFIQTLRLSGHYRGLDSLWASKRRRCTWGGSHLWEEDVCGHPLGEEPELGSLHREGHT